MDEIVVRIARAVASYPRLRLLTLLARHGETTPSRLATELGVPANTLSADLRTLVSAGLIRGRRSGAKCHYALVSPYGESTVSGKMSRWLHSLLARDDVGEDYPGLPNVRDGSSARESESPPALHTALFQAATAFTDLRRLQILRYLHERKEATLVELSARLSMSSNAASRHTDKLRRRGFVETRSCDARSLGVRLTAECATPIHAKILEIVRETWTEKSSRTSKGPG